jgi:hypothetical protein
MVLDHNHLEVLQNLALYPQFFTRLQRVDNRSFCNFSKLKTTKFHELIRQNGRQESESASHVRQQYVQGGNHIARASGDTLDNPCQFTMGNLFHCTYYKAANP